MTVMAFLKMRDAEDTIDAAGENLEDVNTTWEICDFGLNLFGGFLCLVVSHHMFPEQLST